MFKDYNFTFDKRHSQDMNTVICNLDSGLMESNFGILQTVVEDKIVGKDTPYFYKIDRQTFTFPLTITKIDSNGELINLDRNTRSELVRWLVKDSYREFRSPDYPNQIFYVIFTEGKSYISGGNQGYLTLTGRLNSAYSYQEKVVTAKDYSNKVFSIMYMNNLSNVIDNYKPELEFTLVGLATDITIKNLRNNKSLIFTGLTPGETIYVNNGTAQIKSSLGITRLDKCNREWMSLDYGENKIQITTNLGGCKISFTTQFPMAI
ncbi:phage tail family protein [Clostridium estertheticum]|uniref:phage tail family protein n=1 Tax=Clostridium estertheticum TaxID=238834 RepID=UPI001C0C3D71|nr:phage tail family protein [Clostridium estertheticum]MBU3186660.1 phage tail family protein [Clostridium estertheticum]